MRKLLALSFGLAVALTAVEIVASRMEAARLSAPREPRPLLGKDRPRSDVGFRDYDYPVARPPGHFRILVLGDSFTSAENVAFDDSYPKRLERALNHFASPIDRQVYEVMNLGRAGLSTPEELGILEQVMRRTDVDLVIIGYCLNDAEDWSRRRDVIAMRKRFKVRRAREEPEPSGILGFVHDHSAAYRTAARRLFHTQSYYGQIRYYHALYEDSYSGWERTRRAFDRLGQLSRSHRFPVMVMIFPLFSFGLGDDYPFAEIHEKVTTAADDAGVVVLDLFPFYRGLDRMRLESVPNLDPHPSEIAHRIATETLWSFLVGRHLVPTNVSPSAPKAPNPLHSPYVAAAIR